jgi:hypothetical protein
VQETPEGNHRGVGVSGVVNTLRIIKTVPPWVILSVLWRYHGALLDERFIVGMN